ncbi:protein phosphatase 1G [Rhynochetos jubatus]
MGAYLSQPNTVKSSGDGAGLGPRPLHFGFSAMQGWRVSMEDAHNCIPELDSETAMFSVYDGHGGEEVALYCAKYLPEIIKDQKAYKEGKLQKALEDAFLAIDARLTTEEVIRELSQMAGRPQEEEEEKEKVADEDDVDKEEAALLHEEATMTIEELLTRYGQNCAKGPKSKAPAPAGDGAAAGTGQQRDGQADVNGEAAAGELSGREERDAGKADEESTGISSTSDRASAGGRSPAPQKPELGKGDEAVTSSTGEAGPSCSSTGKPQRTAKSQFFEDSEDESDEVEEEEEDSEECSEDEDGYSSEEAENEDDEDDTEEAEEDDEEEEMLLPGMEGKEEPGSDSGTTAVVALIRGKQLIVANAGDSRCVVSEGGKAVDMSYDHKPEDEVELARIKNAGGKVTMDGRVNGGLNLSRAIGDHFYKRNKNLPPEEQMISALPDIKVLTINDDHDFMVIACDGIWNVMSSQEVVDFIQGKITQEDENGVPRPLSSIVEELLDQCLAPDTSGDGTGCDNMTCIIISFKPRSARPPAGGKRRPEPPAGENGAEDAKKARLGPRLVSVAGGGAAAATDPLFQTKSPENVAPRLVLPRGGRGGWGEGDTAPPSRGDPAAAHHGAGSCGRSVTGARPRRGQSRIGGDARVSSPRPNRSGSLSSPRVPPGPLGRGRGGAVGPPENSQSWTRRRELPVPGEAEPRLPGHYVTAEGHGVREPRGGGGGGAVGLLGAAGDPRPGCRATLREESQTQGCLQVWGSVGAPPRGRGGQWEPPRRAQGSVGAPRQPRGSAGGRARGRGAGPELGRRRDRAGQRAAGWWEQDRPKPPPPPRGGPGAGLWGGARGERRAGRRCRAPGSRWDRAAGAAQPDPPARSAPAPRPRAGETPGTETGPRAARSGPVRLRGPAGGRGLGGGPGGVPGGSQR